MPSSQAQQTPKITILASGGGTNFQAIIDAIDAKKINAEIRCLITDRECFAETRAKNHNISLFRLPRKNDKNLNLSVLLTLCQDVDLIVLAGYLSILPADFVNKFPQKIINIHPSLLPKFGGVGMHGMHVHQAVKDSGDTQSGCTTHFVDNGVDTGQIIQQSVVAIDLQDDAVAIQHKVAALEHDLLISTIKQLVN